MRRGGGQQVEGVIWVPIPPQTGPDSMLYADISVIDAADIESDPVRDSVFIVDTSAPLVDVDVSAGPVGTGEDITITVTALDARGLATVGYSVIDGTTGTVVGTDEVPVAAGALTFQGDFTFTVPQLDPTTLEVVGFATRVERGRTAEVAGTSESAGMSVSLGASSSCCIKCVAITLNPSVDLSGFPSYLTVFAEHSDLDVRVECDPRQRE